MSDQQVTATTSQPPARSQFRRLKDCRTLADAFQSDELKAIVGQATPKSLGLDAIGVIRTWIQAASKQPLIYQADLRQALGAFQSLAFLGLQPNTHLNLAHIIPFKRNVWNPATRKRDKQTIEIQVIIGYPGLIELAHRSGAIRSVHCDVVYSPQREGFEYEYGTNQHLRHRGLPPDFKPTGTPLYAYAHFMLAGGGDQFEVLAWHEIEKIRNSSQAYRTAIAARDEAAAKNRGAPSTYTEAPWVKWPDEQAKKTAMRRGSKWVPKCPELRAAAALEDQQEEGAIDWGPVIDGTTSPFDGDMPMQEEEPEPVDPGAAGSMQKDRPSAQHQPADDPADASLGEKVKTTTTPLREPAPKQHEVDPADEFEAAIVDEYGEPASDVYYDASKFAAALHEHWRRMPDPALTEELLSHNADALAVIDASFPGAKAIVAAIVPPDAQEEIATTEQAEYIPATVPVGEGDSRWKVYVSAIKDAVGTVPQDANAALAWAAAQQPLLKMAPTAQRLLAVNVIAQMLGKAGVTSVPDWLHELVKPKPKGAAETAASPASPPSDEVHPDQRLVDSYRATLEDLEKKQQPAAATLDEFDKYTKSAAIQTQMKNLRGRSADLFRDAESLFNATYQRLTEKVRQERQE